DGKFNPEYWNYAKLISGVLRYGMPIDQVIKLVSGLELDSETINTWKNGVERALKKYLPSETEAKGQKCPVCGHETLVYEEGCLKCRNCGASKCG
ncbi:MAG: ribonucleoside-diphosphate reductase, adenosylcobalamin-dependent, partial [Proteiniphilum sp.]|nr:ribonucleoside-diphosphate reductase, adenosylcobalamin-dependent [Proteiniphilum sp.]